MWGFTPSGARCFEMNCEFRSRVASAFRYQARRASTGGELSRSSGLKKKSRTGLKSFCWLTFTQRKSSSSSGVVLPEILASTLDSKDLAKAPPSGVWFR